VGTPATADVDHSGGETTQMSAETIRTSVYPQGRSRCGNEPVSAFTSAPLCRRARKRVGNAEAGDVPGDVEAVPARPAQAANRAVPRLWEAEVIMGGLNRAQILTLLEHHGRLVLSGKLPDGHRAQHVYDCGRGLCTELSNLTNPAITWEQGRDMADRVPLEVDADVEV